MLCEMQNLSLIDEVGKSDSSLAWTSSQSKHQSCQSPCTPLTQGPSIKAVILGVLFSNKMGTTVTFR